jgi:hypothetical protein
MIGRTLDMLLSPIQVMARECGSMDDGYLLCGVVNAVRNTILPVEICGYGRERKDGEDITTLYQSLVDNWSEFSPGQWVTKRECARAFEMRRRVDVGKSFTIRGEFVTGFGNFSKDSEVTRVGPDAIVYRGFLVSSNKETLIANERLGKVPVLYRWVIW